MRPCVVHLRAWRPGRPWVEETIWDGVRVLRVSVPQLPGLRCAILNGRLLSRGASMLLPRRPEFLQATQIHAADLFPAGPVAARLARRRRLPCSAHVIGSDINLFLAKASPHLLPDWYRGLVGAACNSEALRRTLHSRLPQLAVARVIRRGVDLEQFHPEGPTLGPHLGQPPTRFLYLGGFHATRPGHPLAHIKGGHTLIEAWKRVAHDIAPSSLVLAGPGIDGRTLPSLVKLTAGCPRVHWMPRVLPEDVPALMRAADVVVIPSHSEGLPNVANEALACGRAALVTDAGGLPEAVTDGLSGRVVPKADPEALAAGLRWFSEQPSAREQMGRTGRAFAEQALSWSRHGRELAALLSDVAGLHRQAA